MYIIAGLGNPDARYQNTRHNAGFDAIDVIAEKNHIPLDTIKYNALSGSGFIGGQKVLLVKPLDLYESERRSHYRICPVFQN